MKSSFWTDILINVAGGLIVLIITSSNTVAGIISAIVFVTGSVLYFLGRRSLKKSTNYIAPENRVGYRTASDFRLKKQSILLDIASSGTLSRYITTTEIENTSPRILLSKFNHAFRISRPLRKKPEIVTFDKNGPLPTPEFIEDSPQLKSFFVLFREPIKPKQTYEYSWATNRIPRLFNLKTPFLSWEYSPSGPVTTFQFEIVHPKNSSIAKVQVISSSTGEEVEAYIKTSFSNDRESTKIVIDNLPSTVVDIRWFYKPQLSI